MLFNTTSRWKPDRLRTAKRIRAPWRTSHAHCVLPGETFADGSPAHPRTKCAHGANDDVQGRPSPFRRRYSSGDGQESTRRRRSARGNGKRTPTTSSCEGSPLRRRHDEQPEVKWRRTVRASNGSVTKRELTRTRLDEAHARSKTSGAATRKGSSWNSSLCSAWQIRTTSIVRTK